MSATLAIGNLHVVAVVLIVLKATLLPSWRTFAREARSQGATTYVQFGRAMYFFREVEGNLECAHAEAGVRETAFVWVGAASAIEWKSPQSYLLKGRKSLKWVL